MKEELQETKVLFAAVLQQAIEDYIQWHGTDNPRMQKRWSEVRAFLMEESYVFDWGSNSWTLREFFEEVVEEDVDKFRAMARKKYKYAYEDTRKKNDPELIPTQREKAKRKKNAEYKRSERGKALRKAWNKKRNEDPEVRKQRKEYFAQWSEKNKEKRKASRRKYYLKNREKLLAKERRLAKEGYYTKEAIEARKLVSS